MAAVRNYVVRQEREVKVRAENPSDAVAIGIAAFRGEDYDLQGLGETNSEIRETDISAREEY